MSLRRLALGTLLAAFHGRVPPGWAIDLANSGLAGFVLFNDNVDSVSALCASLRAARPDLLIAIDEEGGDVTRLWRHIGSPYPGNAALGLADDPDLTRSIYHAIGWHLSSIGINVNLAPVVDVNTEDDNPVIGTRSFGSTPMLVARHAVAAVRGLHDAGVIACVKHFPGHGAATVDSHLALPTVSATELAPFGAAIDAGCRAVMTAHIRVPSLTGEAPATFSPSALALLRTSLRFDGVIVTDALEMRAAAAYAGGVPAGAVLALSAGADLLCLGAKVSAELVDAVVAEIVAAVGDGRLPESRLVEAATRVRNLATWTPPVVDLRSRVEAAGVQNLAGWTPSMLDASAGDSDIGLVAARRAVRVEGAVPDLSDALVVQLESSTTIAEGRVAWGPVPHVVDGTTVAAQAASARSIGAAAGTRPIVIVGRNLHRLTGARDLITELGALHAVVVVDMGWPSSWRPPAARAFVTTFGATHANSLAVAEVLFA